MSSWYDYILLHPEKPWNYVHLSRNPNITWEIVSSNSQIKWDYQLLSNNKMTKHEFFQNKQLQYLLK